MTHKRSAISLLIGSLVLCSAADANEQSDVTERARLANVMLEIQYLQQYLEATRTARKHNIRTRFDYQKLDRELDAIKDGIGEYVDQIPTKPKSSAAIPVVTETYQQ